MQYSKRIHVVSIPDANDPYNGVGTSGIARTYYNLMKRHAVREDPTAKSVRIFGQNYEFDKVVNYELPSLEFFMLFKGMVMYVADDGVEYLLEYQRGSLLLKGDTRHYMCVVSRGGKSSRNDVHTISFSVNELAELYDNGKIYIVPPLLGVYYRYVGFLESFYSNGFTLPKVTELGDDTDLSPSIIKVLAWNGTGSKAVYYTRNRMYIPVDPFVTTVTSKSELEQLVKEKRTKYTEMFNATYNDLID